MDLDVLNRRRTLSFDSVKSTTSDTPDVLVADDTIVKTKNKKFFRQPFIFKILKLNAPELKWIVLGCISSILFGAITPVTYFIEMNDWNLFSLV